MSNLRAKCVFISNLFEILNFFLLSDYTKEQLSSFSFFDKSMLIFSNQIIYHFAGHELQHSN
jgi:hypothetical protein